MDPCTVETGLLRKKPCGQRAVAHCENCERALCAQHAVAQLSAAQKKTGKFMCKECDDARREYEKTHARVAKQEVAKRSAEMMQGVANPPPAKPAAPPAAAPAAGTQTEPGRPAAPAKEDSGALEFAPSQPKKPDDGGLDFTPSEKKPEKPDDGSIDFTPSKK